MTGGGVANGKMRVNLLLRAFSGEERIHVSVYIHTDARSNEKSRIGILKKEEKKNHVQRNICTEFCTDTKNTRDECIN